MKPSQERTWDGLPYHYDDDWTPPDYDEDEEDEELEQ